MRDKHRHPGLVRCRALGEVQCVDHRVRVVIDQIDFHCGGAPTPFRPLQVLGTLHMQATLRAIFEQGPAKRRQPGRRELGAHRIERFAQRPSYDTAVLSTMSVVMRSTKSRMVRLLVDRWITRRCWARVSNGGGQTRA